MGETAIKAARPGSRIRRPKTFASGRICCNDDCTVVLSRYNRADACYKHRPVVYPRIRGKFSDDE